MLMFEQNMLAKWLKVFLDWATKNVIIKMIYTRTQLNLSNARILVKFVIAAWLNSQRICFTSNLDS